MSVLWAFRLSDGQPPTKSAALVTAQGVLVTAIVFLVGFARSQHERSLDRILDSERRHDEAVLAAHLDHPDLVGWIRLYATAMDRKDYLDDLSSLARKSVGELAAVPRLEAALRAAEDRARECDMRASRLQWSLEGPDRDGSLSREERESVRNRIARLRDEEGGHRRRADAVGLALGGSRGKSTLFRSGRVDPLSEAVGGTVRLILLAEALVAAMLVTYGIAAAFGHWRPSLSPGAHWWAHTVFVAVAVTYVAVTRYNLGREHRRLAAELERLPMATLALCEAMLPSDTWVETNPTGWGVNHDAHRAWPLVAQDFEQVAGEYPALTWVHSIRGRELLWRGLQTLAHAEILRRIADHRGRVGRPDGDEIDEEVHRGDALLSAARSELTLASDQDDPLARVALACVLEQQGLLRSTSDSQDLRTAKALVERAVDQLADARVSDAVLGHGRSLLGAHRWLVAVLDHHTWMWPEDLSLRAPMTTLEDLENAGRPTIRQRTTSRAHNSRSDQEQVAD